MQMMIIVIMPTAFDYQLVSEHQNWT